MGTGRLAAVADTGPLIHLAEIECLDLLAIFEELHIPEGVWQEAERPSAIREQLTFAKRHTLEQEAVARFTLQHGLSKLQAGERKSLSLCSQLEVEVLLTDDLIVRRAAKSLGLTRSALWASSREHTGWAGSAWTPPSATLWNSRR